MISRHRLDDALLAAARAAGACVEEGVLVQAPVVDDGPGEGRDGCRVASGPCRLRAPIVIAADGASSRVARALGLARHARSSAAMGRWRLLRRGRRSRRRVAAGSARCTCAAGRYIGIAPLPGGVTNACVVTADRAALRDPARLLRDTLHTDPQLAARFAGARMITQPVLPRPARRREHGQRRARPAPRR